MKTEKENTFFELTPHEISRVLRMIKPVKHDESSLKTLENRLLGRLQGNIITLPPQNDLKPVFWIAAAAILVIGIGLGAVFNNFFNFPRSKAGKEQAAILTDYQKVKLFDKNGTWMLMPGENLKVSQGVETVRDKSKRFSINDRVELTLFPESRFFWAKENEFLISFGNIRSEVNTEAMISREPVNFSTPQVVCRIIGTLFDLSFDPVMQISRLQVLHGKVRMSEIANQDHFVMVTDGQSYAFDGRDFKLLTPPKTVTFDDKPAVSAKSLHRKTKNSMQMQTGNYHDSQEKNKILEAESELENELARLLQTKDYEKALKLFEKKDYRQKPGIMILISEALMKMGMNDSALSLLDRVDWASCPEVACQTSLYNLAQWHENNNRLQTAIIYYVRYTSSYPKGIWDEECRFRIARMHFITGARNRSSALNNYLEYYPQGQYISKCKYWMGQVEFQDHRNYKKALGLFKELLSVNDVAEQALYWAGCCCLKMGKKRQANEIFQKYISRFPNGIYSQAAREQLQ
ncbi:MAG: tetratricopeptide repeat protein [bacterium]